MAGRRSRRGPERRRQSRGDRAASRPRGVDSRARPDGRGAVRRPPAVARPRVSRSGVIPTPPSAVELPGKQKRHGLGAAACVRSEFHHRGSNSCRAIGGLQARYFASGDCRAKSVRPHAPRGEPRSSKREHKAAPPHSMPRRDTTAATSTAARSASRRWTASPGGTLHAKIAAPSRPPATVAMDKTRNRASQEKGKRCCLAARWRRTLARSPERRW